MAIVSMHKQQLIALPNVTEELLKTLGMPLTNLTDALHHGPKLASAA